jgi:hypothetical protein
MLQQVKAAQIPLLLKLSKTISHLQRLGIIEEKAEINELISTWLSKRAEIFAEVTTGLEELLKTSFLTTEGAEKTIKLDLDLKEEAFKAWLRAQIQDKSKNLFVLSKGTLLDIFTQTINTTIPINADEDSGIQGKKQL